MIILGGKFNKTQIEVANFCIFCLLHHFHYFWIGSVLAEQSFWLQQLLLTCNVESNRVARWHIFKPKALIWVNFGGSCNGRCWYILWPFCQCSGHLVLLVVIWYIHFPPIWYVAPREIWQPWSAMTFTHKCCHFKPLDVKCQKRFIGKIFF
jgi:hypothetical protein